MHSRSTRVIHRLPRSSRDEVERTENPSRYTRESQTSQPGEDKKDIAEMIRLAAAKAPGLEVDHTLHIPVHPQGCAPCYNYSSHVIEVTGIDRNADQLSKYWKRHLRGYISELRDVSYENGRRDGHRDNDVEIDRLQARVEELESELTQLRVVSVAPPSPTMAINTAQPSVVLPPSRSLVDRLQSSPPVFNDKESIMPGSKGKGKAVPVCDDADVTMDSNVPIPNSPSHEGEENDMRLALRESRSYADAAKRPPKPGGPSSSSRPANAVKGHAPKPAYKAGSSSRPAKTVKDPERTIGPPRPNRLFRVEGLPIPRGQMDHPHYREGSRWAFGIKAQDIFPPKTGGPEPKYGRGSEEFKALVEEAYFIPFDQRSVLQRNVVKHAYLHGWIPPAGFVRQFFVEKHIDDGNKAPLNVRRKETGLRTDDLAVYQFLRSCGFGKSDKRSGFVRRCLRLLASGDYPSLVDITEPIWGWNPRPLEMVHPSNEEIARHLWTCGLDMEVYVSMFRPYALRGAPPGTAPAGGPPPVAPRAAAPSSSRKRRAHSPDLSQRPRQKTRASEEEAPRDKSLSPPLPANVVLPSGSGTMAEAISAMYEDDRFDDDEPSLPGYSPSVFDSPLPRPVDDDMAIDDQLNYGDDDERMGPG